MDEDNSTKLAEMFQADITQIITIFPYMWKHYPYGNWFVNWNYSLNEEYALKMNNLGLKIAMGEDDE